MDLDRILVTFNDHGVKFLLIGGVNFLLRHKPVLTFDIDFWIEDAKANIRRCEKTLAKLNAEWGKNDDDWGPVAQKKAGWLARQTIYCLTSPLGAIDLFLQVAGLGTWRESARNAASITTESGVSFYGLSDADMLKCQEALPEAERKIDRMNVLREALRRNKGT